MRMCLSLHGWDVLDFEATTKKHHLVNVHLHVLAKHQPTPQEQEPEGPGFHRGSHLADSSRAGWTPEPDTRAFGFGRRR